jgi:hypothetical protein
MTETQTNPTPPSSRSVHAWEITKIIMLASVGIFLGGFILMVLASEIVGYKNLPNTGKVIVVDGHEQFAPSYPYFRQFIISDPGKPLDQQNTKFHAITFLGRGLFFYTVTNAPHWILEMKFINLRMIAFIPFISLLIGCGIFFIRFFPPSLLSEKNILELSITICVFHAVLVIAFTILFTLLSSTFHSMFGSPHFYVGELIGVLVPGFIIILVTGLFFGAIIGAIYSVALHFFPPGWLHPSK